MNETRHQHKWANATGHTNQYGDICIAACYGSCFLFGISGNIVSLRYFLSKPRRLSILLYRMIALNDIMINTLGFPVMLSIATRQPMMFGSYFICTIWATFWDIFSFFSVFLVCMMSTTRAYHMALPFRRINTRRIMIFVSSYLTCLVLYKLLFILVSEFEFTGAVSYCFSNAKTVRYEMLHINYEDIESVLDLIATIFPVLPIIVSCVISIVFLNWKRNSGNDQIQDKSEKQKASKTIIIFTLLYIGCNVPVVMLNVAWFLSHKTYPEPYFTSKFMYLYAWNVFMMLSVCVNSACNPIIYITRNEIFKSYIQKEAMIVMRALDSAVGQSSARNSEVQIDLLGGEEVGVSDD